MYAMLILVHYYNSNTTYFSVANKLSSNSMAYVLTLQHCRFFFTIAKNSALLYTDKDAINCTILNKNATKVTYVVYLEYIAISNIINKYQKKGICVYLGDFTFHQTIFLQ